MKIWAVQAAQHAALTSGFGAGVVPVIGSDALDGFALGALLAGLCFAGLSARREAGSLATPALGGHVRVGRQQRSGMLRLRTVRLGMARTGPGRSPAQPGQAGQASQASSSTTSANSPASHGTREDPARWPERTEDSRPYADLPYGDVPRADVPRADVPRAEAAQAVLARSGVARAGAARQDGAPGPDSPTLQCAAGPAGGRPRRQRSRIRRRLDTFLVDMLGDDGDDADEAVPAFDGEPDESFWGPQQPDDAGPSRGYRSRHRLPGPGREPKRPDGHRGAPRHAAPPAGFSARLAGRAARAAW